ncbi:MAG: SUMF1/EgtB/PvdO family nonheme iron enzyme [Gammaproteobacteria bacterium]|nr:SUMF1/EgtB/PvdO family nonheme iron enzyme [Gammaproteobacteria bacterium]
MSNNNFARDTLEEGSLFLWYRIKHVLGKGGFGITYLATDINLDREVAIKEYLPSDMATREDSDRVVAEPNYINEYEDGLKRFIREARTIAKFDHPNVVKVLNVFEENGTAYMVMAYERGKDLKEFLKTNKTLGEDQLLEIIVPILEGLELVHEAGFIHRDIKPGNIMIREDGNPVLIDFGSAHDTKKTTKQVTTLVSPGFTPHEQYTGQAEAQGPWTDIYSLGATLYKCICGRNPVDAITRGSALIKQEKDPLVSAADIGAGRYSDSLLEAIDHALEFNENKRPKNISEWTSELLGTTPSQRISSDIKQQANARRKITHSIGDTQEMATTHDPITIPENTNRTTSGLAIAAIIVLTAVLGFVFLNIDISEEADISENVTTVADNSNTETKDQINNTDESSRDSFQSSVQAIAKVHKPGAVFSDRLKIGISGPSMIVLPTGEFNIGSQINEDGRSSNEGPQKKVKVSQPVAISKTEVTVGQFRMFVEATGYVTEAERNPERGCRIFDDGWRWESGRNWKEHRYEQSDKHPVVCVSWDDALAYIDWLSLQTGQLYSLPSEVEWEYAARSGSQKARFWEEEHTNACRFANVSDLTRAQMSNLSRSPENIFVCEDGYAYSAPVASFDENAFGFNDMLGNVWEWTADCWNDNYDNLPQNGQPRLNGNCDNRVYRGGSWGNFPDLIRAAKRGTDPKDFRYYNVGFRVSRIIQQTNSSALVSQELAASRQKI